MALCPNCNEEGGGGKFCQNCGKPLPAPLPEKGESKNLQSSVHGVRDVLRQQRSGILKDIQRELSDALREANSSISDLDSSMPGLPDFRTQMSDRQDRGTPAAFPESRLPAADAAGLSRTVQRPSLEQVTTRNLEVQIQMLPRLSYALTHAGLPLIRSLAVRNTSAEPAHDLLIKAWVAPDYGEPWQKSVPSVSPGGTHTESDIVIPLNRSRLQEVREAERAGLRADVYTEGSLQYSETLPIEVLAYNDWYYHPAIAQTLACFVQPNSVAVEKIVSLAQARLRRERHDASLSGYQSGSPEKALEMIGALYLVLQEDLQLGYINPPASFERGEKLPDGSFTLWQKIFFPEQILEHRHGTCLDLAVLCASCLERIGLHPLVFIIRGHAFFGVWTQEKMLNSPVLHDHRAAAALVSSGDWIPMNSTTFTASVPKSFDECIAQGMELLLEKPDDFQCAIDITSARSAQTPVKPLPPVAG